LRSGDRHTRGAGIRPSKEARIVRELAAAGYEGKALLAEVKRLTGLDSHNAAVFVGIETGQGPFGDTEPPVREEPLVSALLNRLLAKD
jgi:hypothetical protein